MGSEARDERNGFHRGLSIDAKQPYSTMRLCRAIASLTLPPPPLTGCATKGLGRNQPHSPTLRRLARFFGGVRCGVPVFASSSAARQPLQATKEPSGFAGGPQEFDISGIPGLWPGGKGLGFKKHRPGDPGSRRLGRTSGSAGGPRSATARSPLQGQDFSRCGRNGWPTPPMEWRTPHGF